MVVEEALGQVSCRRRDLDDVDRVPRAAQCHVGAPEHAPHIRRLIRLTVTAWLLLFDEPDDRRITQRQLERRISRTRRTREGGRYGDHCRENGTKSQHEGSRPVFESPSHSQL